MIRRLVWIPMLLMVCTCLQYAFAMGDVITVTRQTQAQLGLNYSLVAERVDKEAILVGMEIARKGKLKNLRSVSLRIGPGRPLVAATLQTTPGKKDTWVVSFQLSPELAGQCCIDLIVPTAARSYEVYAVELKGYVTDRK